jgi:hypothetical protein
MYYLLACVAIAGNIIIAQILAVPQKNQEQSQWCWDATSQAVLEYYGVSKTQTEIAQYGTNGTNDWNWLYGRTTGPTRNGVDLILNHFGGIRSAGQANWFTLEFITAELASRRPVPIRWEWDAGGGHIFVIHGVADSLVYLMDPLYGPTINTYAWVRQGSSHTWTHSLKINTTPVYVDAGSTNLIKDYVLYQNFPNPFNPSTNISFSLPCQSFVSLKVFDLLGRYVVTLVSEELSAGNHTRQWNAATISSGVYFYRLQAGSFVETKKLVFLR